MNNPPRVVLDACVLVSFPLCDTLLRLAEEPRLYCPRWSDEILAETTRTLEHKLGWPHSLVTYFESELRRTFPEASVVDYEQWISRMTNDLKDRHVSASAVSAEAKFIATFNLRHFKSADLAPWDVTAIHPQQFLANLFQERPDIVRLKLREQAERRKIDVTALLGHLRLSVPQFVDLLQA